MPRRSALARLPLLLSLCLNACAAAQPPPATDLTSSPASSASAAPGSAIAVPARRVPSEALLRYWPFDAPPTATLYADLGGLLHTELGTGIVPTVLSLAQGSVSDGQAQCLRGAVAAARDLVFGADASGAGIVLAHFDDAAFDPAPCLVAEGARAVRLEGADQAFTLSDSLLVRLPGLLLVGPEPSVRRALVARSARPFPQGLALGPNEFVAWSAIIDQNALNGTLLASSERFRLAVDADVAEADAKDAEQGFLAIRQKKVNIPGLRGPEAEMFSKLLQAVTLERKGSHLSGALDLREKPVDQARDIAMLAALSVYGVRKYMLNAKVAEARNTIAQIALSYTRAWQPTAGKPGDPRKLLSLPAVPPVVPKGSEYQSAPADWKTWQAIGFQLSEPQYYQYEVRAAKDGRSADIIAHGDLDADGKQSEFRLHLTLGPPLAISEQIEEHDPEE